MAAVGQAVAETLADWLLGLDARALPEAAREGTLFSVIDTVGLSYAARREDYMGMLVAGWDGAPGKATAFGHGRDLDAVSAAMINGTGAHGEDFDNTYEGCPVHSGAVVVPAVLALAQERGIPGARAFVAMAAGIEIMCRMGLIAGTRVHKAGYHPTAVIGAMGAAAAAGVALGLDRAGLVNAFGLAGSMASGIIEYLADGSWTKRMHAGWAAQAGIRAARMAGAGFRGPATVFEGTHGFYFAFAHDAAPDFSPLVEGLGQTWEAGRLSFKPYACGTMCQPYIDCAVRLAASGVRAGDVDAITCKVGEGTVHRLWAPLDLKRSPPSAYGGKFSGPYCVAVGFLDGDAGLAQFTEARVRDAAVLALAAKVSYEVDPQNEYPANYTGHVRAVLKDGSVREEFQPCLRGGVRAPLTRADIVRKFRANLAYGGMAAERADRLLALLEGLPGLRDLAALSAFRD